jgi:glycogen(starch) synthase
MRQGRARRIVMTGDAVGGVWAYALSLAEALGAEVEILLAVTGPAPGAAQSAAAAALPNLRVVAGDFRLEWMPDAGRDLDRAADWLKELVASHRPDILHINGYAAAGEGWQVPVLVIGHSCVLSWWRAVHGTRAPREWDPYARRVACGLARADAVIAPSSAMLRALSHHYGLPRGGRVIANGCALERFRPAAKEPFILAAGRFWDEAKNLAALDAAAARLPWPVFIAGDCRHPDGRVIAPNAAASLGSLSAAELTRWMSRAAIYALPARYEPFGLSVLEAAASGCALVLGDIPSLREIWEGAALFVPPADSGTLADAVGLLIADKSARRRLGAAARHRAKSYSAAAMAHAYSALYDELLAEAAPRSVALTRAG